jgi:hypothetical protein
MVEKGREKKGDDGEKMKHSNRGSNGFDMHDAIRKLVRTGTAIASETACRKCMPRCRGKQTPRVEDNQVKCGG